MFPQPHDTASNRIRFSPGFTLVELLVVIAIVLILGALLLPSLRNSVELAHKSVCVNNLRQVGMCFSAYNDQNHGLFPCSWHDNAGNPEYWWFGAVMQAADMTVPQATDFYKQAGILVCPSEEHYKDSRFNYPIESVGQAYLFYGYNCGLLDYSNAYSWTIYPRPVSALKLPHPAKIVCVADSGAAGRLGCNSDSDYWGADPRHNGQVNALFCDYHVDSRTPYYSFTVSNRSLFGYD